MKNAQVLAEPALPALTDDVGNREQELRNDFTSLLSEKNLKWHSSEVASMQWRGFCQSCY